MNVIINALKDAGTLTQHDIFSIFKRMYSITYPHWILDYKENDALPEACGLVVGLYPVKNKNFSYLRWYNKLFISGLYGITSLTALVTPVFIFKKSKNFLYQYFKR